MFATTFAKVTAAAAALLLLVVGLILPEVAWEQPPTLLAAGLYVVAWGVAIATGSRAPDLGSGRASAIASVPVVTVGLLWGLAAAGVLAAAVPLGVKWVLGAHGAGAVLLFGASALFKGAGAHMDQVEAAVAATDSAHAELSGALAQARLNLGRLQLEPALAQRARTLLDKAQALPRSALAKPSASGVVTALRSLAAASDPDAAKAAADAIESKLVESLG